MTEARDRYILGLVKPGYEAVAEQFDANFRDRGDTGAAFAAMVEGEVVVDVHGGWADQGNGRRWGSDTIAGIFSGTKGFVATCLLLLIERGQLDLDRPVSHYWPEFQAEGKGGITVGHVVSHRAGLPCVATPVTIEQATDDVRMAQLLARQPPICEPGTQVYYHALTFGWLCGELIRRIDGRSVGRMFAEDVAEPLGLEAWIGLPVEQEGRVAVLERGPGFGAAAPEPKAADLIAWSIWDNPPRFSSEPMAANTPRWRAAEIPAGNGVASARAVARLYGCLARRGTLDGVRLLRPDTIDLAIGGLARGFERYLKQELVYGVGFQLQTRQRPSVLYRSPLDTMEPVVRCMAPGRPWPPAFPIFPTDSSPPTATIRGRPLCWPPSIDASPGLHRPEYASTFRTAARGSDRRPHSR